MRNRIHEEKGKCVCGGGRCVCVWGGSQAKRIQGSSLGRRAQVQLSRAKVLGCRTVFHRDLFGNWKWTHVCFLSFHSRSLPRSRHFSDSSVCIFSHEVTAWECCWGRKLSHPSREALWRSRAGRRTDSRDFISHCSEFPVYFLTAEPLSSCLQGSLRAWLNRESDSRAWRPPFTTHLSFND